MLLQATVEHLDPYQDARGFVVEPLSLTELAGQKNVHVVWTATGAVRGNHRHMRGSERTLVICPGLIRYKDAGGLQEVFVPEGAFCRFTFPPSVAHAFGAVGPEPLLLVCFNTVSHDPAHPDTMPELLLTAEELTAFAGSIN